MGECLIGFCVNFVGSRFETCKSETPKSPLKSALENLLLASLLPFIGEELAPFSFRKNVDKMQLEQQVKLEIRTR